MSDSSLQDKQAQAHAIVATATTAAAVTGGIPIPFADMFPLIGEQVTMLGAITAVFGFKLNKRALTSLVYAALSVSGATFVGKTVVASVLKAIPVVGQGAGIAVSATTAGTLTLIMGEAYIKLLSGIAERDDDIPPIDDLIDEYIVSVSDMESVPLQSEPEPEPEPVPPSEEPAPPFQIRFE